MSASEDIGEFIMEKNKLSIISLVTGTITFVTLASSGSLAASDENRVLVAQAQTSAPPPQAPSFLKQAGQKLLDSAQKKVLHSVNERMQQPATKSAPPQAPQTAPPTTTTVPGAPVAEQIPTATTTVPTAPRQQAPCRSWSNPGERPIACLLCVHGLGLQSNSYEFFAKETSNRGLAVYAIDVRGFGSWMNAGGKAKVNFDDCLADIKQALESIRAANPNLPVYILGESMGGAIALRAASMFPELVDGLISSVPAGERFNQGKTSMKVFLNLLSGFDVSNVGGDILNQATRNSKLKTQWSEDPLARLNLTPQELIQFQDFMNTNHDAAKKLANMPVLFVQGNGDQLVKPEGTWELFNAVASKDKSFFAVPGEHLIFEEAQTQDPGPRDQNFRVIQSWLSTKVGRRNRGRQRADISPGASGAGYTGTPGSYNYQSASGTGYNYPGAAGMPNASGTPVAAVSDAALAPAAQLLDQGRYAEAISQLESLRTQRPNDPQLLGLLGRAYYMGGQPDRAGWYFRSAMRAGRRGGDSSRMLNNYMLQMSSEAQRQPPQTVAPTATPVSPGQSTLSSLMMPFAGFAGKLMFGNPSSAATTGGAPSAGAVQASALTSAATPSPVTGRGKVYAFYAKWADQCKGLSDILTRLSSMYGDRVEVTKVDIEDTKSDPLVDQFKIGPIPTVVFVAPNGQVTSTVIGECTYSNYEAALKNMGQPLR